MNFLVPQNVSCMERQKSFIFHISKTNDRLIGLEWHEESKWWSLDSDTKIRQHRRQEHPYKLSLDTETNFRFDFNSQACNFSIIRWEACQPSPSTNISVEFEQKPHFSKIPSLLKMSQCSDLSSNDTVLWDIHRVPEKGTWDMWP